MTLGRKAIEFQEQGKPVIDVAAVHTGLQAMDAQQQALVQQQARVRAVATQLGYQLPADATDPDLIQRDIAANMSRTAEAMLQVGLGLICLKEACQHGEFMARLEVLRFEPSVAQRYMKVARKLSNTATSQHLLRVVDSQSKLLELIVLDDGEIEELAQTGETGELKLDDVATMSVKDLRAKVRELRQEKKAQADISTESKRSRDERINKLEDELATLKANPKPERTPELIATERLRSISDATLKSVSDIEAGLRSHFMQLEKLFPEGEVPNHARLAQQQALSQIIQAARALAGDFGISLKLEDLEHPELLWMTQGEALFGAGDGLGAPDATLLDSDGD